MVVARLLLWLSTLGRISLPAQHLGSWWTWRVKHDDHHRGVVRSQLAHAPPVHREVHQLLAWVLPLVPTCASAALQHVLLIVRLRCSHRVHCHLWAQHIPRPVSSQDKAALFGDVNGVDMQVRFRGDDKDVLLAVVAPEVTEGPGNGKEWDFVDGSGSTDGTSMPQLGSVPYNSRHSRLVHHLQTQMLDTNT